jgi:hypothetical protein
MEAKTRKSKDIGTFKNAGSDVLNLLAHYLFKYGPIGMAFLELDDSFIDADKYQLVIVENEIGLRIEVEKKS